MYLGRYLVNARTVYQVKPLGFLVAYNLLSFLRQLQRPRIVTEVRGAILVPIIGDAL